MNPNDEDSVPRLTSDLDYWQVVLNTGEKITLRAHGVAERDDHYVFVALMEGQPPFEYELCRIPVAAVKDVSGGWTTPREP